MEASIDIVPVTPIVMLPPRPMNPGLPPVLVIDDQLLRLRLFALIRILPASPSPRPADVIKEASINIVPGVLIVISPPRPPSLLSLSMSAPLARSMAPASIRMFPAFPSPNAVVDIRELSTAIVPLALIVMSPPRPPPMLALSMSAPLARSMAPASIRVFPAFPLPYAEADMRELSTAIVPLALIVVSPLLPPLRLPL